MHVKPDTKGIMHVLEAPKNKNKNKLVSSLQSASARSDNRLM